MPVVRNLTTRIRHCDEAIAVNQEDYFLELLAHFSAEDIELLEASTEACQFLGKLIRAKMLKAAHQFIKKFSSSTKLLSEKDDNNLPPLWYAVQQNNFEFTHDLLPHHDLWSIVDETNGQRLLHLAAKNLMANKILSLLISLQPNLDAFDHNGDTPLHIACKDRIIPNITAFIIADANFNSTNNSGMTPVQLIMQMPESLQLEFYRYLHYSDPNKHELVFINNYRNYLAANPSLRTPQSLSIFYKLCAQKSLRCLLLAQHEFNPQIPVRATYAALKATRDKDKTFTISGEADIPEEILKSMPIYTEKMASKFLSNCEPVEIQSVPNKKIPDSRQDSVTLIQLISEIDVTIAELNRLPKWDLNTRTFWVAATLLLTLASVTITTLSIFLSIIRSNEAKKYDVYSDEYKDENEDKYWADVEKYDALKTASVGYAIVALLTGVIGFICGSILLFYETKKRWNRDRLVSLNEYQQLMNHVKANLLANIQELERNKVDALPVTTDKIRTLETTIADLNREKSVSEVITILQNLKTNLQDINISVANTQKSFRLFKAQSLAHKVQSLDHVVVEISENERRDNQVQEPDQIGPTLSDDSFRADDDNQKTPLLEMERIARR